MNILDYIDDKYSITPAQLALLKALTFSSPDNAAAFAEWVNIVEFERLDNCSYSLMPALFRTFKTAPVANPYYARIKGIYCALSYKNSLLFAQGKLIVKQLIEAGIEVVFFKGAALALKYHKDISVRPMGDIDFLVRPHNILKAEKILLENKLIYAYDQARRDAFNEHSFDYINPANKNGYDLHWYSLYESLTPNVDDEIWGRAEIFDWDGVEIKVMSAEDLIFTSCISGVRNEPLSSCQWIYDVIKIVQAEPAISWGIVYCEAAKRNLQERLFYALYLVHKVSPNTVPLAMLNHYLAENKECHYDLIDLAKGKPGTIQFSINQNKEINHLYINFRDLDILPEIFYMTKYFKISKFFYIFKKQCLDKIKRISRSSSKLRIKVKPGTIKLREKCKIPYYAASIKTEITQLLFYPKEKKKIKLLVINNIPCLWVGPNDLLFQHGLSYHLQASNGEILVLGAPRSYFIKAQQGCVNFMKSQEFVIELEVEAPNLPGNYLVQLDIVHENVTWYSQQGNKFPCLKMQVKEDLNVVGSEP